jgi:SAM-dependent methyltransferase
MASTPGEESAAADANEVQRAHWDGDGGVFWATHADRLDAEVAAYRTRFLDAADVQRDSRVLDVGCGNGRITLDAARRAPAGQAVGVDLSSAMLRVARRRAAAEALPNVLFLQADAQVHPFAEGETDLVLSRNGSMFFADPHAGFGNLARALRPGGRLVLLTWQPLAENEWLRNTLTILSGSRGLQAPPDDAPSPMALSRPERVHALLEGAGFTDVELTDLREPMFFGVTPEDAFTFVSTMRGALVEQLEPDEQRQVLDELRADLARHHTEQGVRYDSAAWLVQARRP